MIPSVRRTPLLPLGHQHLSHTSNARIQQLRSGSIDVCRGAVTNLLRLTISVTFLISLYIARENPRSGTGVAALSCMECDPSECHNSTTCPGGLILDVCSCCLECANLKNQKCNGNYGMFGRCDRGLHCFIPSLNRYPDVLSDYGFCKDQELLCNDNCPEAYEQRLCPPDSLLKVWEAHHDNIMSKNSDSIKMVNNGSSNGASNNDANKNSGSSNGASNNDANKNSGSSNGASSGNGNLFLQTQLTSYCVCNTSMCEMPVCEAGYSVQLVRNGTNIPGECCNVYVCRRSKDCQSVVCPPYQEGLCPRDSIQIPSKWTEDGCCELQQGCACLSVEQCEPVWCPKGFQVKVISRASNLPGSCCDKFRCVRESDLTCRYKSRQIKNGQTWQIDKCKTCHCRDGLTKCKDKTCKNLSCTWMVIPEGECCPVCRGCVSDSGYLYNDSAVWQENDCTTCTCKDGQAQCQSEMCAVHCVSPTYVPGRCCPICADDVPDITRMCPGQEHCSTTCKHGLEQTSDGCFLCRCKEEKCKLDCQFGFKADVEGNNLCECKDAYDRCPQWEEEQCEKKCEYGYKQSRDGCLTCKCKKCPQFSCTKRCIYGYVDNDEGCPLCKCKEIAVPDMISSNFEPENTEGRSCMSWYGSRHENGESWNDGCRLCYCHNGAEMCSLIACTIPHCTNPVFRIGDCCPTCPGYTVISSTKENEMCESSQGQYYVEGETWKMDLCTHCICHRGTILCETPSCPPVICHHPIKPEGQCCAICRGTDELSQSSHHHHRHRQCSSSTGILYKNGDVWRSTPCQSCVCRNTQIDCYNEMCPPLNCNRTVLRKGHCCPTCVEIGKPKICTYGGVIYETGEKWHGDNCTQCSCNNGQIKCFTLPCPHLDCTYMIRKREQCCPICSDKTHLHSDMTGSIGRNKNMLNTTAMSANKSNVDGNIVGIAALGVMVFILAIGVFLLALYLMTWKRPSALKQRPTKSTNIELQGQVPFLPEQFGKTVNSEKQFLEKLCPSIVSVKGEKMSNEYTDMMMFKDQTKDNLKVKHGHFLSSKIM